MPALIRAFALLVPLLLAITGIAHGQQATLIIHNNTDATLSVFTQNAHSSSIQSQPVVVPPLSRGQATVPMGQSVILAEAINMTGTPDANWSYNFHHSGAHELEIFASNFGMSVMFDQPGSVAPSPSGGTLPIIAAGSYDCWGGVNLSQAGSWMAMEGTYQDTYEDEHGRLTLTYNPALGQGASGWAGTWWEPGVGRYGTLSNFELSEHGFSADWAVDPQRVGARSNGNALSVASGDMTCTLN
jgi:hypothetical protein